MGPAQMPGSSSQGRERLLTLGSGMGQLDDGRDKITSLMIWQGQHDPKSLPAGLSTLPEGAAALPLCLAYVDADSSRLVVGLDKTARGDTKVHQRIIRDIVGDLDLEVRYVAVERDACPHKKGDCRPIRGGVRQNTDGTLSIVILQAASGEKRPFTIVSSHVVGPGTGQVVGQPGTSSSYGVVTVNPSLKHRASDCALTSITNHRVEYRPYAIWAGKDDEAFEVTGFSDAIGVGDEVRMQGAHSEDLATGRVTQTGVVIKDGRGTLTDQVLATYPAEGGDSGGPVFTVTEKSRTATYIGIHAGRAGNGDGLRAFFSRWAHVRAELAIMPADVPHG